MYFYKRPTRENHRGERQILKMSPWCYIAREVTLVLLPSISKVIREVNPEFSPKPREHIKGYTCELLSSINTTLPEVITIHVMCSLYSTVLNSLI